MENLQNEYTLTADELGMIKPLIEAYENTQKETHAIFKAIIRLRNLDPNSNWSFMGDKLVKAGIPALQPMAPPQPVTEPNGLAHQER